jgi:hypothetical protein
MARQWQSSVPYGSTGHASAVIESAVAYDSRLYGRGSPAHLARPHTSSWPGSRAADRRSYIREHIHEQRGLIRGLSGSAWSTIALLSGMTTAKTTYRERNAGATRSTSSRSGREAGPRPALWKRSTTTDHGPEDRSSAAHPGCRVSVVASEIRREGELPRWSEVSRSARESIAKRSGLWPSAGTRDCDV